MIMLPYLPFYDKNPSHFAFTSDLYSKNQPITIISSPLMIFYFKRLTSYIPRYPQSCRVLGVNFADLNSGILRYIYPIS